MCQAANNVLHICVCVPRKNVSFKAHRLLAHNANVLLADVKIAAYANQETEQFKKEKDYDYPDSSHFRATEKSILNAYPKELIQ
jgi:hypothetical protein